MRELLIIALTLFSINQGLALYRGKTPPPEVVREVRVEVPVVREVQIIKEVRVEVPVIQEVVREVPVVQYVPQQPVQTASAEPQWFYYKGERFRAYPRR